ncbi:glycosyl hydrolase family 17 protein [Enterovibrio norvegicus]|uniref:glycoside hydrolase family 17 protein n=1 Tax=Enterovibrio norvegicus TaxID=188144 RepID=UPI0024B2698E|nr:glycosyl hydrolase family 17 protein [Enterovibrio norvegicus]
MELRNAICYSGYREGQNPREGIYPSYDEVKEDLQILSKNWGALRLYDCSHHARLVLDVIENEGMDFKVMLGADVAAEMNNPGCPWGAQFSEEELAANRQKNSEEIDRLIALANEYPNSVGYVSVGNEASVEWTDHLISVDKLVEHVERVKSAISQPVTFCENYVPWTYKLGALAEALDFISVHTYPIWEYKTIDEALEYTKQNYYAVRDCNPGKPVVITEAGWATASNGRGIEAWNANQELQAAYYEQLMEWTRAENILTFVFEAFDEPWKGDSHPEEPEKHWGLFKVDRTPKLVMQSLYGEVEPA